MSKFFKFFAVLIVAITFEHSSLIVATAFADEQRAHSSSRPKDIDKVKKAIVTIAARVPVTAYRNAGSWTGTGFIVDLERGLLMTNNHVVGRASAGNYYVTFHNGQQAEAKAIYYDAYADFAVMQVNPSELPEDVISITFAKKAPNNGDEVFIVGNTEAQGFSFHSGYLSDLYDINGEMPQGSYVINMNTTGGASGSPIINADNRAIGILYGGGKTHALALKQQYLEHALKAIAAGEIPKRQHIGVIFSLYSLDKAVKHRDFPKEKMENYIKKNPNSRNRAIVIRSVLSGSPAQGILQQGDIIWEINDMEVAADLASLDHMLNKAGSKVKLTIYRNGKKMTLEVATYDLNERKVSRMFDFAGALFFEADDFVSYLSGAPLGSVCAANVQTGSSFSAIPEMFVQDYKSIYRIVVNELNGSTVRKLDDLVQASKAAIQKKYVNLVYTNYQPYRPEFNSDVMFNSAHESLVVDITFDAIDNKPRLIRFDPKLHDWVSDEI